MTKRVTVTAIFAKQIDATSSYYFQPGHVYDLADDIADEVIAAGAGTETPSAALDDLG